MARSIGEAIAQGLDLGYSRVVDYNQRREQSERQRRLDDEHSASLADTRRRQGDQEQLTALGAQEQLLKEEGLGLANATTPVDPGVQQDYARRVSGLRTAKNQTLSRMSGYDLAGQQKAGAADLQAVQGMQSLDDLPKLQPGQFTRANTVGLGRSPNDYVRPPGGMSPIEKAGMNVLEGLETDDMGRVISGLNVLHAPELSKGVGAPAREGGTVVSKRIVNVVPDPNSKDPENPSVIPVLRVYVNSGKEFRGPLPPDVPEGATGYYDAPLTQSRSSDPNDPVRSIGINEAMEYIQKQMQHVEFMNSPQAVERLKADQAAGAWNPDEYLQALTSLGVKPQKQLTTDSKVVPAGGTLVESTRDATGKLVSERRIQGTPRSGDPLTQFEASINAAHDRGEIDTEARDALLKTARERAAAGGGKSTGTAIKETPAQESERLVREGKFKTLAEARAFVSPSKAANEAAEREMAKLKSPALGGLQAPHGTGDRTVEFWARAVIAGDKDWQVGLGRSKSGSNLIEAVKRRVPALAEEMGLEPQDIGTTRAMNAALAGAMKDLTKRNEAVDLFSSKVEKDMATFDAVLEKAGSNSPLLLNRPLNALRRQFSDPGLAQLDLAAKQVGTEYERLITGGTLSIAQLHTGAQEDAKKLINGDMPPKQARAIMETMRIEMKNARTAANESVDRIQEKMRGLGRGREAEPAKPGAAPAAPAAGTVKGGYRFKGGNPADKANWEKV